MTKTKTAPVSACWKPSAKFWTLRGLANAPRLLAMPAGLYPAWKKFVTIEHPNVDKSERAFARSASGLMDFLAVCVKNDLSCVLPSAAADSVWHAWLFWDAASFKAFSEKIFGRVVVHRTVGEMSVSKEEGIQNTWVTLALIREVVPYASSMPALFELDRKLKFPGGWAYAFDEGALVHANIGADREFSNRLVAHPLLCAAALKSAFVNLPGTEQIIAAHEAYLLKRYGSTEGGGVMDLQWGGGSGHCGGGDAGCDGGVDGGGGCGD